MPVSIAIDTAVSRPSSVSPQPTRWTAASYGAYRATAHWQSVRVQAIRDGGHKCRVCGSAAGLDVYHNDYSRLGGELPTDLVVLCQECRGKTLAALPY